jgi:hypothetical protein
MPDNSLFILFYSPYAVVSWYNGGDFVLTTGDTEGTEVFNWDEGDKWDGSALGINQHTFLASAGGWRRIANE